MTEPTLASATVGRETRSPALYGSVPRGCVETAEVCTAVEGMLGIPGYWKAYEDALEMLAVYGTENGV